MKNEERRGGAVGGQASYGLQWESMRTYPKSFCISFHLISFHGPINILNTYLIARNCLSVCLSACFFPFKKPPPPTNVKRFADAAAHVRAGFD